MLSILESYTNYLLSLKVEQNTDYLSRSESIIRNSNRLHRTILEMQSAFRGYLLTEDTSFLYPYKRGLITVPVLIEEQLELIHKDESQQRSLLDSISILHHLWIGYSSSLLSSKNIASDSSISNETYLNLFETKLLKQVGKKLNDAITTKFLAFDQIEYRSRNQHSLTLLASIKRTHTTSLIFLALTIIIGIISTTYIVRLISSRIASMTTMADKIAKGDFTRIHDTRQDELTMLSDSLNVMCDNLDKNIRALENKNAELHKFTYVVSHDLKAPLRGIHNVIQWIEEDLGPELSPQLRKYLHIIPQRTKRMENLINGLLEYARINEKTQKELIDTKAMVQELAGLIVPREFDVQIGELPFVFAERLKLEQIFSNLLSNSVKYTPVDGGHIFIQSRETSDYYEFSVKDNGIGIDAEYHQKIFEIFQTLREKNEKESTGIGLAIVKKIIDEHNGTIRVVSKAGEGTEMIFTWPKKLR